jgi:hypothetical protein
VFFELATLALVFPCKPVPPSGPCEAISQLTRHARQCVAFGGRGGERVLREGDAGVICMRKVGRPARARGGWKEVVCERLLVLGFEQIRSARKRAAWNFLVVEVRLVGDVT